MFVRNVLTLLLCSLAAGAGAATYKVTNTGNAGAGSLRWAINSANANPGAHTITFDASLGGAAIQPTISLPALARAGVSIDGDLNNDGQPDAWLDGGLQPAGSGLVIEGNATQITGLAVTRFPKYGVVLSAVDNCRVRSCHLGVSLDSTQALPNREADLALWQADYNVIGGSAPTAHNVIAGGNTAAMGDAAGLYVVNSHYNTIAGNYIGLRRNGLTALGSPGRMGLLMSVEAAFSPSGETSTLEAPAGTMTCSDNTIGSTDPAGRNVIGAVHTGMELRAAERNTIRGNFLGLGKDGNAAVPLQSTGLLLRQGAANNVIGGGTHAARNVFSTNDVGLEFRDAGTVSNRVYRNYLGLNASGTAERPLAVGIRVSDDAGAQTIGGSTADYCNHFVPNASATTFGVTLSTAGDGATIRNNRFGVRPDGQNAAVLLDYAIAVGNVQATITQNLVARSRVGIDVGGPSGDARVYGNTFRSCGRAVRVTNLAACFLGNLNNANSTDNGDNTFATSNTWHVDNRTSNAIRAEGNAWGTTVAAQIDAKIYDQLDDASCGRVDYVPLQGGGTPTGSPGDALLAVTGAVAQPTARGAEIAFNLTAPAAVTVEVLNLGGRVVAVLQEARTAGPGLQRVAWTGRTHQGTAAPAGAYLVRIVARNAAGRQASALAAARLER